MDNANKSLMVVAIGMSLFAANGSALAQKACTVVTKAEAQSLATAKLDANESEIAAMNMSHCAYVGPGKNSTPSVLVTVAEAAKMFPGLDARQLKETVVRQTEKNTKVIPGIGDGASYTQRSPTQIASRALVKGKVVILDYEADDAAAKKDKVIELLKTAASRI